MWQCGTTRRTTTTTNAARGVWRTTATAGRGPGGRRRRCGTQQNQVRPKPWKRLRRRHRHNAATCRPTPAVPGAMASTPAAAAVAAAPAAATAAVLVPSQAMPDDAIEVKGYDFNQGVDYCALMASMVQTGYQATNLGLAIEQVRKMISWRLSDEPVAEDESEEWRDPAKRAATRCTIYLAYTSNMVSSGLRETIRFLVEHRMVDVVVASAGGVEEDLIKCLAPTYVGDFELAGRDLRQRGLNRIGNLLVPNDNYCKFEDWIIPILDKCLDEQVAQGTKWTPSKLIHRLGLEINHPDSILYWAAKNDIPIFCPALTDGSLGDMIYFHSYRNPGFVLDLVEDIRRINDTAVFAKRTGMIILGGGLVKHHTCNANLMRNGADYSVYINTGQEFDGSDSGARPDEAVSWGKIRTTAKPVKVYGDATILFPLLVAETFAKEFHQRKNEPVQ